MTDHYIDRNGVYVGGYGEGAIPEIDGLINLGDKPPEYADQVWLFPGWSDSPFQLALLEEKWREQQMPLALNNVTAIDFGDDTIPGAVAEWKAYWLALRKWTDINPDFPDSSKRPVAPS
ncbi:hypothetical protein [Pseudomonas grimontii]|uniref:hypothetical protein n=1 Tax=Pseudomonas grimontii TaxID=129847 RepID=UPI0028E95993|nr:hypothetical protein [Pseudomonas grimontii]